MSNTGIQIIHISWCRVEMMSILSFICDKPLQQCAQPRTNEINGWGDGFTLLRPLSLEFHSFSTNNQQKPWSMPLHRCGETILHALKSNNNHEKHPKHYSLLRTINTAHELGRKLFSNLVARKTSMQQVASKLVSTVSTSAGDVVVCNCTINTTYYIYIAICIPHHHIHCSKTAPHLHASNIQEACPK